MKHAHLSQTINIKRHGSNVAASSKVRRGDTRTSGFRQSPYHLSNEDECCCRVGPVCAATSLGQRESGVLIGWVGRSLPHRYVRV
jgi:hypothetical protein